MKCPIHPRYAAKKRPAAQCYQCWVKYVLENKREKFTAKEMLAMGEAAVEFEDRLIMGKKPTGGPVVKRGEFVLAGTHEGVKV